MDDVADHIGIGAEIAAPHRVGKDGDARNVTLNIGVDEIAPEGEFYAERRREESRRRLGGEGVFGFAAGFQGEGVTAEPSKGLKALRGLLPVEVVRVGGAERRVIQLPARLAEDDEFLRVAVGKRAEEGGIDDREIAVFAPIPRARVSTMTKVKAGLLRRERRAYKRFCLSTGTPPTRGTSIASGRPSVKVPKLFDSKGIGRSGLGGHVAMTGLGTRAGENGQNDERSAVRGAQKLFEEEMGQTRVVVTDDAVLVE